MLQFQQHLFCMFFSQMTSYFVHYDVIWYPFPVNSQYLKMWGVDSPAFAWQRTCQLGKLTKLFRCFSHTFRWIFTNCSMSICSCIISQKEKLRNILQNLCSFALPTLSAFLHCFVFFSILSAFQSVQLL